MGQIRNSQIINNDLTGASINRNFKLYDETENVITGEVRKWQDKRWRCIQNVTGVEESNLTQSPDLATDYWVEIPEYREEKYVFESFSAYYSGSINNYLIAMAHRLNFNKYRFLLYDIYNNGNFFEGKQFSTQAELESFLNANCTNQAYIEVYGRINQSFTSIHRMQGVNESYGLIKGKNTGTDRGNYYKGMDGSLSAWGNIDSLSVDILKRITGVTPSTSYAKNCIWFPHTSQNFYKLYQSNHDTQEIVFTGGVSPTKRKFNPFTNSFSNISSSDVFHIIDGANGFYRIDSGSNWHFMGVQNLKDEYYLNTNSYVKVYGVEDQNGNIAAIIKPVGMDMFYINNIETPNYHIYAGYYNQDRKLRLELVDNITHQTYNNPNSNISVVIKKSLLSLGQRAKTQTSPSKETLNNVVLFFGDEEGNISRFSRPITWNVKKAGAKYYALINNEIGV